MDYPIFEFGSVLSEKRGGGFNKMGKNNGNIWYEGKEQPKNSLEGSKCQSLLQISGL